MGEYWHRDIGGMVAWVVGQHGGMGVGPHGGTVDSVAWQHGAYNMVAWRHGGMVAQLPPMWPAHRWFIKSCIGTRQPWPRRFPPLGSFGSEKHDAEGLDGRSKQAAGIRLV